MLLARLRSWAAAIGFGLAAVLYAVLRLVRADRERERERAQREALARQAVEHQRELEQEVAQAQHGARLEAAEVRQQQDQLRQDGRRPDVFGDPRLRGRP